MRYSQIVDRLRAECHSFEQVDHAAGSISEAALPRAIVALQKVEAAPAAFLGTHFQPVEAIWEVMIVMRVKQDGPTGTGQADLLDDLRAEVRKALVGWTPEPSDIAPVQYVGGEVFANEKGIMSWREMFSVNYEIRN